MPDTWQLKLQLDHRPPVSWWFTWTPQKRIKEESAALVLVVGGPHRELPLWLFRWRLGRCSTMASKTTSSRRRQGRCENADRWRSHYKNLDCPNHTSSNLRHNINETEKAFNEGTESMVFGGWSYLLLFRFYLIIFLKFL